MSTFLRTMMGAYCTFLLTRLALSIRKDLNAEEFQNSISALSLIWATGMLILTSSSLNVKNSDRLSFNKDRPTILLLNHGSFFDFILLPLIISTNLNTNKFLPRFLLAKKHFKKNPLYYRILGLGLLAEKLDMIFVNRRGNVEDAKLDVERTGNLLKNSYLPLAIFPQGTRARRHRNLDGSRNDAGYYAVGSKKRLESFNRHIKKGCAHIIKAADPKPNVMPIFIKNAATLCPKGSSKIQSAVMIDVVVGEPLRCKTDDVDEITREIDDAFKLIGDVDRELIQKLQRRLNVPDEAISENCHKQPFFPTLDIIFSLRPEAQKACLQKFVDVLRTKPSAEELEKFRMKIVSII